MSFYDAIRVGASGAADFEVERSLRFNDDDTAYLNRTFGSAGNRKTYTISAWVKIGNLGTTRPIFNRYTGNSDAGFLGLYVNSDDFIYFTGWSTVYLKSSRIYRDPTAWSHILLAVDTTQSTSTDRIKLYFNGELQTLATYNAPSQDADLVINEAVEHRVGNYHNVYFDGYMAELNFVDGSALTPSSFGKTDTITGQWNPKKYTGSYGTNGFYLNFSDNSGTTATTLGKDSSGNGNNFTPNNFSVSAGAGNDSLEDTPTNNFPTLNPLYNPVNTTFGEGNLLMRGGDNFAASTFLLPKSGKWYVEFSKYGNGALQSISVTRANTAMTNYAGYLGLADNVEYVSNGELGNRSRGSTSDATAWTSDADIVVAAAVDMDNGAVYFARANTWQNSGDPTSGSSKTGAIATDLLTDNNGDHVIAVHGYNGNNSYGMYANFGQQPLTYTPPTGYKVLSSANLPDPTILLPNKHFDTKLWSGNSSTQAITGLNFSPDWVWSKRRSASSSHYLSDTIRGVHKILFSELTGAEYDGTSNNDGVDSFDSNGFTLQNGTYVADYNASGSTYVGWSWNAGDTDGKTYTVTVVSDSGNKYRFDGFGTSAVTLDLAEGGTYTFDQSDSSMSSHPMQLSTTANGTHGGGSAYSTGVTYELDGSTVTASAFISGFSSASSRKLIITVAASAPTLYYYCYYHSGMGGAINTNSTLGSSNFAGSRQATTKVNATAGFSIVTSTSGGSSSGTYDSFGHGLGVAPNVIIFKNRDISDNWGIYNSNFSTAYSKILQFNTIAETTSSNYWGTANPSSTTFSLNQGSVFNGADEKLVAYCFSEVAGYSKFGKYTGNGNSDGTFVFTGFRPAWVMIKRTDSSDHWNISDAKRDDFNEIDEALYANLSNAEGYNTVFDKIDYLSNGFKIRANNSQTNASGGTYIYLAFSESPFKNARAR